MGKFEETHILPRIRELILLYIRFIDDIFFLWKGSERGLLQFFDEINSVHPTIRFVTTVYTKPTDRKAYLHAKSCHPRSTKDAIPFSQATRLRRICTEKAEFAKL